LLQVSLHLICVKDEVARAWPPAPQQQGASSSGSHSAGESQRVKNLPSPFVSEDVLEVIESVLRPEDGASPELPAQIDSVSFYSTCHPSNSFQIPETSKPSTETLLQKWSLPWSLQLNSCLVACGQVQSALNLYRFILIREFSGMLKNFNFHR
jgi:hypothetical protein